MGRKIVAVEHFNILFRAFGLHSWTEENGDELIACAHGSTPSFTLLRWDGDSLYEVDTYDVPGTSRSVHTWEENGNRMIVVGHSTSPCLTLLKWDGTSLSEEDTYSIEGTGWGVYSWENDNKRFIVAATSGDPPNVEILEWDGNSLSEVDNDSIPGSARVVSLWEENGEQLIAVGHSDSPYFSLLKFDGSDLTEVDTYTVSGQVWGLSTWEESNDRLIAVGHELSSHFTLLRWDGSSLSEEDTYSIEGTIWGIDTWEEDGERFIALAYTDYPRFSVLKWDGEALDRQDRFYLDGTASSVYTFEANGYRQMITSYDGSDANISVLNLSHLVAEDAILAYNKQRNGIFVYGDYYFVVARVVASGETVRIYRNEEAGKPEGSWIEIENWQLDDDATTIWSQPEGKMLHIVSQHSSYDVVYRRFNMEDQSWDTEEETVASIDNTGISRSVFLRILSNEEQIISHQYETESIKGTRYHRIAYTRRIDDGEYDSPIGIDDGDAIDWQDPLPIVRDDDRVYFLFSDNTNSELYIRTLDPSLNWESDPSSIGDLGESLNGYPLPWGDYFAEENMATALVTTSDGKIFELTFEATNDPVPSADDLVQINNEDTLANTREEIAVTHGFRYGDVRYVVWASENEIYQSYRSSDGSWVSPRFIASIYEDSIENISTYGYKDYLGVVFEANENIYQFQVDFKHYYLEIDIAEGEGTTDPDPGTYEIFGGEEVTIEAIPDDEWSFEKWIINSSDYYDNPITIKIDEDTIVDTYFSSEEQPILTIDLTGEGSIKVDGEEIEVPYEENYNINQEIVLEAFPVQYWDFDKWEIDESEETENPITITMDDDKDVVAYFVTQNNIIIEKLSQDGQWEELERVSLSETSYIDTENLIEEEYYNYRIKKVEDGKLQSSPEINIELRLKDVPASIYLTWDD